MKKLLVMAGMFSALVFTACKKDKNDDPNPNPGNGGGNTKLLKKVTKTEEGVTTIYNVTYDGNKRIQGYANADNSEYIKFSYDGAGNVTKVENKEGDFFATYTYTYQNGQPLSATLKAIEKVPGEPDVILQDDILTYTIANGKVTKIHQTMNHEDPNVFDIELSYDGAGNLSKAVVKGEEDYTVLFTFGTKKNAFPYISKWVMDLGFSLEFSSKNELIETKFDYAGGNFDYSIKNEYTYDNNGYPTTSESDGTTLKFEYQ